SNNIVTKPWKLLSYPGDGTQRVIMAFDLNQSSRSHDSQRFIGFYFTLAEWEFGGIQTNGKRVQFAGRTAEALQAAACVVAAYSYTTGGSEKLLIHACALLSRQCGKVVSVKTHHKRCAE